MRDPETLEPRLLIPGSQSLAEPVRVISFSLWGDNPTYTVGALRNAEFGALIYAGWQCRFYCGSSVPEVIIAELRRLPHVRVVEMAEPGDWRGTFWRFYPASDPDVAVMLSRDTDSRLTARERAAVDAWLASNRDFHVMRDHPKHCTSILGGMWGVRNGLLRDMRGLIDAQLHDDRWQADQEFLAAVIAPRVRHCWLEHDEYFARRPFPCARVGRQFVGQPFDALDRPLHERPTQLAWAVQRTRGRLRRLAGRVWR